jgi:hypothetical protein
MHGPDREVRKRILDKASIVVIAIAVFVGVCGGAWGLYEQHELVVSGDNHHAQTVTQNDTIEKLLGQHTKFFDQVEALLKTQAKYDADVKVLAEELIEQEASICTVTGAQCPPLTIPGS